MPLYEVKAWIRIHADDEDAAEAMVEGALDNLVDGASIVGASVEGEGSTYEVDDDEDDGI